MKNTQGILKDYPRGCILKNWGKFKLGGLKRNKLLFSFNTAWPQYALGDQAKWPQNESLNFNTILQLDLFCKQSPKWEKSHKHRPL